MTASPSLDDKASSPAEWVEGRVLSQRDVALLHDLLRTRATAPQPIAEDVSHLFALYGIDTDSDCGMLGRGV